MIHTNNKKEFVDKIRETLLHFQMVNKGERVLLGVSGGADSIALLHGMRLLSEDFHLELGVAHLNHSLRGAAADQDADFVKMKAKSLFLPFHEKKSDVMKIKKDERLSLEEAARKVRYDFFLKIKNDYGYDKIALGHNADDNAEAILMFLIRGSGGLGLSGIPPMRDNIIIRPLIMCNRSEILEFLKTDHLNFVNDESNNDFSILRNSIRHELIPFIKSKYNPKIVQSLFRLGTILRSESEWMEEMVNESFLKVLSLKQKDKLILNISFLNSLNLAVKRRILRRAVLEIKGELMRITFDHIETMIALVLNESDFGQLHLPGQIRVVKKGKDLVILKEKRPLRQLQQDKLEYDTTYQYQLFAVGIQPIDLFIEEIKAKLSFSVISAENLPHFEKKEGNQVAFFDIDKLWFPLLVRNVRPGDLIEPLGMKGRQKVKKVFSSYKIPTENRCFYPIVENRGKIIWIAGLKMAENASLEAKTKKILKASISFC